MSEADVAWKIVEVKCNEFKRSIIDYRKHYSEDQRDDAWYIGWCLGHLDWTSTYESAVERLLEGIELAFMMRGLHEVDYNKFNKALEAWVKE